MTEPDATGGSTPQALVERALSLAGLPTVATVTERSEANLRWANNALTTNGEMRSRSLTITSFAPVEASSRSASDDSSSGGAGGRPPAWQSSRGASDDSSSGGGGAGGRPPAWQTTAAGTVSREIADIGDVAALVEAAEQAARSGRPAEDAVPLVPNYAHADCWDAAPETTSIEVLADLARGLGEAIARARDDGNVLFGFAEHIMTTTYLGTSTGLRRRGVQPTGRLEVNAKTAALTASAWAGRATRDFAGVDMADVYGELSTRLRWAATTVELPPGRYETLLPPSAVADLMIYTYWTAGARDAEEGRSVFAAGEGATRIGERLAELPITLRSDPEFPGLEALPFVTAADSQADVSFTFDGGLPIGATTWIADGVLHELIRNRAQAERNGRQPTPPADNLIMDGQGTATLEEMIARTERGLLLTCLWYIREVDPERLLLTGLSRDGVYLIEHGQVVGAVNNFRFNESPVELLGRITEVGAAQIVLCREWNDYFNKTVMPPVRVPDFNMSTVSQAS
jgi:predicted Zn-dependent protease